MELLQKMIDSGFRLEVKDYPNGIARYTQVLIFDSYDRLVADEIEASVGEALVKAIVNASCQL